jgi:hypothetical protein
VLQQGGMQLRLSPSDAAALVQHCRHGADLSTARHGWEARGLPRVAESLERGRRFAKERRIADP